MVTRREYIQRLEESHQRRKLSTQRVRARRHGEADTLTWEQWRETLAYFHNKCAYCRKNAYAVIEHFIPIGQGVGTTWDNCVPACAFCNHAKIDPTGYEWMPKALKRVGEYLAARRQGIPIQLPKVQRGPEKIVRPLREWRDLRYLSLEALAVKADVSSGAIWRLEHGARNPRFRTIRKLAQALGIEPSQIEEAKR